jgi:hypothetical protein
MSHDGCCSGSHECRDCKHHPKPGVHVPSCVNRLKWCEKCSHYWNCQFEKDE